MSSLFLRSLRHFSELINSFLDFIYPPHCLVCGRYLSEKERDVCEGCWNNLGTIPDPFCPVCRSFLHKTEIRCSICSEDLNLLYVKSLGVFDDFYKELIHRFKYKGKLSLGKNLSRKLAKEIEKDQRFSGFDLLIPVPLHPARKRERGSNQSEIIGGIISGELNVPFSIDVLKRVKNTKDQTKLNEEQRKENVKDAFEVSFSGSVKDKKIILVDDVITTGATLNECARILKNNGAKKIVGVTLVLALN